MATAYHNLSDYDFNSVPNAEDGIIRTLSFMMKF